MKCFVTGATGFVGSHLVAYLLKNNYSVVAMRRSSSKLNQLFYVFDYYKLSHELLDKIEWYVTDDFCSNKISDLLSGCSVVFHCAAIVDLTKADKSDMYNINYNYTRFLLEQSAKAKVKKFCYLSSIAALGDVIGNDKYIDEESPIDLDKETSIYGISKRDAMNLVISFNNEEMKTYAVCPGPILGVSINNASSVKIIYLAKKGVPFAPLGGTGYVDVQDVCRVLLLLIERENTKHNVYQLVGANLSNRELLTMLLKGFKHYPPLPLHKPIVYLVAILSEIFCRLFGIKNQLDLNMARIMTTRKYYSSKRVEKDLDFEFTPIEKTVKNICNYMSKN